MDLPIPKVLGSLRSWRPWLQGKFLFFVTAYNQYAIEAFERAAINSCNYSKGPWSKKTNFFAGIFYRPRPRKACRQEMRI